MIAPIWILPEVVQAIHKRQLAEHGGSEGIRDPGLLDSALTRAQNLFFYSSHEMSLPRLAAAYAFGIARNHPFVDGNKRTAFVVCMLFLKMNGCVVHATQEKLYDVFTSLADGSLSEENLWQWLESVITHTNKIILHEPQP
jgi:death-on-curing protein